MEWVPQEMGGLQDGIRLSEATASMQLIKCASEPLRNLLLMADPNIQSKSIDKVKSIMRQFAVIPVAIGVRRTELMQLRHASDELFRTFAARVKGKTETCMFTATATCTCN